MPIPDSNFLTRWVLFAFAWYTQTYLEAWVKVPSETLYQTSIVSECKQAPNQAVLADRDHTTSSAYTPQAG